MKKQPSLWDGHGVRKFVHPRAISPVAGWFSKASVHDLSAGTGGSPSRLSHQALTQDPRERDVSSAALETIQIKDKLKTRMMSEDLLASQRGKVGACMLSCGKKGLSPAYRASAHSQ